MKISNLLKERYEEFLSQPGSIWSCPTLSNVEIEFKQYLKLWQQILGRLGIRDQEIFQNAEHYLVMKGFEDSELVEKEMMKVRAAQEAESYREIDEKIKEISLKINIRIKKNRDRKKELKNLRNRKKGIPSVIVIHDSLSES